MARRLIDADRRRELRRQGLLLDRLTRKYERRFNAEISRAMREMLDAYAITGEVGSPRDHYQNIEAIFRGMVTDAATVFGGRIAQQGKDAGLVLETKGFAETMARLALSYVASEAVRRKITSISDTTRAQIINAVSAGYEDGLGVSEIARMVRAKVPQFSVLRSALIARTETHGAANFGANEAAKETGLPLRKEWIAARDERTRLDHSEADGQIVGMDDPFIVGGEALMYPGDPSGSPENVINCRCATGYVVQD